MSKRKRSRLDIPSNSRVTQADKGIRENNVEYYMDHPFRGHAVIFHHFKFNKCLSQLEPRVGSELDVKSLKKTLNNLDFHVSVYRERTLSGIRKIIKDLANHTDHTDADCVAIFVLSHGNDNNMIYAKDAAYSLQELWNSFTANNCPSLAGKPKLFFIQACRGDKSDCGMTLRKTENIVRDSECDTYRNPGCEDFLIIYSSMEGYGSYRDTRKGSWFIQTLCKELEKLTPQTDLLKIATRIVGRVALEFDTGSSSDPEWNHKKQVPHVHSTLTRDVYFYPK